MPVQHPIQFLLGDIVGQFQYHLDDIYNNRWQEYHLFDGTVKDSRMIHWRQVQWEDVVKIVACIRTFRHEFHPGNDHRGFITYRSSGMEFVGQGEARIAQGMRSWFIGHLSESHAHVTEINFQTGRVKGKEVIPIKDVESHIHPRLKQQWQRKWNKEILDRRAKHAIVDQGHL